MKKKWKTIFLVFFIIMFFLTIVSRIVNSWTVPRVKITKVKSMSLENEVTVNGVVEGENNSVIRLPEGVVVENIFTNEKSIVEKDDVLLSIDRDSTEKKINLLTLEYEKIQSDLENQKLEHDTQLEKLNGELKKLQTNKKDRSTNLEMEEIQRDMYLLDQKNFDTFLLDLERVENDLNIYKDLLVSDCVIKAKNSGVVIKLNVQLGVETTTSSSISISDSSKGLKLVGAYTEEEGSFFKVGQKVTATKGNGEAVIDTPMEIEKIYSIEESENQKNMFEIKLDLNEEIQLNDNLLVKVQSKSINYKYCVPLSAIKEKNNGEKAIKYITQKETILGNIKVIEDLPIKIIDKNDRYAALEENENLQNIDIVVDSNKEVFQNDRVFVEGKPDD